MQAIFNEMSALQSEKQAIKMILDLIQVCKQLQVLDSTFKMRINEHFWNIQLDGYGTIREYLENSDDLTDGRYFLYAITDSPYLPNDDMDIDAEKFLEEDLTWGTTVLDAENGIRVAYAFDPKPAPMISFASDIWQSMDFIEVKPKNKSVTKLINIATSYQIFDIHFETIVLGHLKVETANPTARQVDAILPNKNITNAYLDYKKIYIARNGGKILKADIPITNRKIIGGIVAKINGWIRHEKYSKINNREVFNHHKSKTILPKKETLKCIMLIKTIIIWAQSHLMGIK